MKETTEQTLNAHPAVELNVERLFNLGNYNHLRLGIRFQLLPGQTVGTMLENITQAIELVGPLYKEVIDDEARSILYAKSRIEDAKKIADDDWTCGSESKADCIARLNTELENLQAINLERCEERKKAYALLNCLGMTSKRSYNDNDNDSDSNE